MKKLTSNQIRQLWLDFFKNHGHEVIASASLIPNNDPSLLWINAGVAPLKKYFDGREKPSNPRMCNAQKCIRTNDIDNVGKTARHHTFFEMLGNFSIGDYFRDDVLNWAYELLFSEKWYGFDPNNIYITYYPLDHDTYQKWLSLGIKADHLIPIKDNFWEIGEGPCGPDTEIFYDRGPKYDPNNLGIKLLAEDIENDRYIEIWNIVFSQYNAKAGRSRADYPELPSKNIDTGSGLERLACIFQQTETNYETDLFMPLIKYLENYTKKSYDDETNKMAFRVIVDHIRSVTFAVADGAMLSNEGRGYVLRRLLRRAVRYGRDLGIKGAFLYQLVAIVIDNMKEFYPYLATKQVMIEKIIKTEEENFLKTLNKGEKKLQEILDNNKNKTISGIDAFLLYDTFGFPLELTIEAASKVGYNVDKEAFLEELTKQKNRARDAMKDAKSMSSQNADFLNFHEKSIFVGYEVLTSTSKVVGLFQNGKSIKEGTGLLQVVLDKTPFYAEMGGQIGDRGQFITNNSSFDVLDTIKMPNGQHLHLVDFKDAILKLNDEVEAVVDQDFREAVAKNHSATHLLNEALRVNLGSHVSQQGSQVTNKGLRFDFNHFENLSVSQILQIEKTVCDVISKRYPVITKEMSLEEAKKTGAQAVFGEKYGKVVRLVDMNFSKELCGGTHVKNVQDIKEFAVTSIESKGSGIYRIEGVAGEAVKQTIDNDLSSLKNEIMSIVNKINEMVDLAEKIGAKFNHFELHLPSIMGSYQDFINYRNYAEEVKKYQREIEKNYLNLKRQAESTDYRKFAEGSKKINDTVIINCKVVDYDLNALKDVIDKLANDYEHCLIFFANVVNNDKIIFIAKAKNCHYNAGNLVKQAALLTGGNGGGRPDFAQAGGKDVTKVDDAIKMIEELQ